MEHLLLQEHETKQLRVERHSLKVGLDTANMTIGRMENETDTLREQLRQYKHEDTAKVYTKNNITKYVWRTAQNFFVRI